MPEVEATYDSSAQAKRAFAHLRGDVEVQAIHLFHVAQRHRTSPCASRESRWAGGGPFSAIVRSGTPRQHDDQPTSSTAGIVRLRTSSCQVHDLINRLHRLGARRVEVFERHSSMQSATANRDIAG
jgi:hypothetical protein